MVKIGLSSNSSGRISSDAVSNIRHAVQLSESGNVTKEGIPGKDYPDNGKINPNILADLRQTLHNRTVEQPSVSPAKNDRTEQIQTIRLQGISPEQIRSRIAQGVPLNSSWAIAEKTFNRESVSGTIDQLSKIIASEIPLMMIEDNLSMYCPPVWKMVYLESFITEIRKLLIEHEDILGALSYQNYRELFFKVKTMPDIQNMSNKVQAPEHLINF